MFRGRKLASRLACQHLGAIWAQNASRPQEIPNKQFVRALLPSQDPPSGVRFWLKSAHVGPKGDERGVQFLHCSVFVWIDMGPNLLHIWILRTNQSINKKGSRIENIFHRFASSFLQDFWSNCDGSLPREKKASLIHKVNQLKFDFKLLGLQEPSKTMSFSMPFGVSAVSWCSEVASSAHQKILTNRRKQCWLSVALSSFIDFRPNLGSGVESNSVKKRSTNLEKQSDLGYFFCESEWVRGRAGPEGGRDGPNADGKFGKARYQQDGRSMKMYHAAVCRAAQHEGCSPYKTNQRMRQGNSSVLCILPCVPQEHRGGCFYIILHVDIHLYIYI